MKRIIVFGGNGMLGSCCVRYLKNFYNVVSVTRSDIDVSTCSSQNLIDIITKNKTEDTVVLNCAGLIPQRGHDKDEYNMIRVNSVFPKMLSRACTSTGVHFIHVSTDCVYDGKRGGYTEEDIHTPTDIYGITKSSGEGNDFMTIRTSIIGEEIHNKLSLLEWVRSQTGKRVEGYTNHLWNGVTCLQFAKIIKYILDKNIKWKGARHLFSPDIVTKCDLIRMINDIYDLNIEIIPVSSSISTDKSLSTIYKDTFTVPSIRHQIIEQRDFNLNLPNIFIVTSAINPIDKPIDGGHTRSVFSPEQRIQQTIHTVKSIFSRVPNAFCIIVESTNTTDEQKKVLFDNCNLFIDCSNNGLCSMFVNGNNKSLGETMTLYQAMKYILENNIKFNTLSKISGRYYLDDNYNFDYNKDEIVCRLFSNSNRSWYSSVLYTVGWNRRWMYFDMLFTSLFIMDKNIVSDIECNMFTLLPKNFVRTKDVIGVSGLMSANGELASH